VSEVQEGKRRKAYSVQLFDARVEITLPKHEDPYGLYGTHSDFVLYEGAVEILAKIFSVDIRTNDLGEFRAYLEYLKHDVSNLIEINAKVISERVLDLELVYSNSDNPEKPYRNEITYCGSFSVAWM
jgi:hypothetical protein